MKARSRSSSLDSDSTAEAEILERLADGLLEEREEQLVLAIEVLVEPSQRLLRAIDDLLDRELGRAPLVYQRETRIQDSLNALLRAGARGAQALRDRAPTPGPGPFPSCRSSALAMESSSSVDRSPLHSMEFAFSQNENRIAITSRPRVVWGGNGLSGRKETRMRIGLMLGPERGRYRQKVAQLIADAVAAEEAGFTSIWVPQIPGDFDAFTAMTLMGHATERSSGTAVMPIQTRHPIAMAQEVLSVQAVCEGRFTLGLGVSHHWVIEGQLGLPYERPAHQMRSYLEVLNAALRGPGRWTSRTTGTACTARWMSRTGPPPQCCSRPSAR